MLAVQRPPGEVEQRRDHDPDRELADVPRTKPDRAEERERRRDDAEQRPSRTRRRRSRTPACESALAPVAITISSNTDQPRHCRMFSPVGRYEPRRPSGARSSTIVGTRASAPISPPSPSITLPTTAAATIAPSASGSESASPNWSSRAARGTRPRRSRAATPRGSPRAGSRRTGQQSQALGDGLDAPGRRVVRVIGRSLRRHDPDQVRRV